MELKIEPGVNGFAGSDGAGWGIANGRMKAEMQRWRFQVALRLAEFRLFRA